jgi:L-fucose isomerase-like protein
MSRKIKVGYAPLQQAYFNQDWAKEVYTKSLNVLHSIDDIQLITPSDVIMTEDDAKKASAMFIKENVDLRLVQGINCDLGILATILGKDARVPILVWSLPEQLLHEKPLLANSLCGAMIITSAYRRLDINYKHMHGSPDNNEFIKKLENSMLASGILSKLREDKLGLIGYQSPGFFHVSFDEMLLRRTFGVDVQHIDISEVYAESKKISTDRIDREIETTKSSAGNIVNVKDEDFTNAAKIYLSVKNLCEKYSIQALAIKCFPEFFDEFRLAPCAVLGQLTDNELLASCEGDMVGALTMLIEYYLTKIPPFFADLIALDEKSNTGVAWHCGNGPACLAEDQTHVTYDQHSVLSEDEPIGLTRNILCKKGDVTFARISERDNEYIMFAAGGESINMDEVPLGTVMKIRFNESVEEINKVLFERGIENHFAIAYGDIREQLQDFSKWLGIKTIIL